MNRAVVYLAFLIVVVLSGDSAGAGEDLFHVRAHRAQLTPGNTSPRARSMGGSKAALSNGASCVYENPAGLGAQTDREAIADLGFEGIDDDGGEATWVTVNAGGSININVCAPYYWPREDVGNRTVGMAVRSYAVSFDGSDGLQSDMNGMVLAYGRSFRGGRYFFGGSIAYDTGDMEDDDRTIDQYIDRFEMKLGWIHRPNRRMALGGYVTIGMGSVENDGSLLNQDGDLSDISFNWGAAYQMSDRLLLVGDVMTRTLGVEGDDDEEEHHIWKFSGGAEYMLVPDMFALRGGLYYFRDSYTARNTLYDNTVDDYGAITGGLSYFKDGFELGYTLEIKTTGEFANFFRLEYDW